MRIGVFSDKLGKGITELGGSADLATFFPFTEALLKEYDTDAHFVTYQVLGDPKLPRINKEAYPEIKKKYPNAKLVTSCFVFDYDNPKHRPWTDELLARFRQLLKDINSRNNWVLGNLAAFYTTTNGARLIYVLREPVEVESGEMYHRGFVHRLQELGLDVDEGCSDWTRMFRLPRVMRDGSPTKDLTSFECVILGEHQTISYRSVDPLLKKKLSPAAEITPLDWEHPDPSAASLLIKKTNFKGTVKYTSYYYEAKTRSKGTGYFACVFDDKELAQPGGRNTTLIKYVGAAVTKLFYLNGTTPDHIFALFCESVGNLDTDKDTPDWFSILYKTIKKFWETEVARQAKEQEQERFQNLLDDELRHQIVKGMLEWNPAPELRLEYPWSHASKSLLVDGGGGSHYYLLKPDGSGYGNIPLSKSMLIPGIKHGGLASVINLTRPSGRGQREATPQEILNAHAMPVHSVVAMGGVLNTTVKEGVLYLGTFARRTDLVPQLTPQIDEWLSGLFSIDNQDLFKRWISWALAFEEGPIAALLIHGVPGCGKQLIARALMRCITSLRAASDSSLSDKFNEELLTTPFIVINEGFESTFPARKIHHVFRKIIGGDPQEVGIKYGPKVRLETHFRVLLTANTENVLGDLVGNATSLTIEDRQALAVRIVSIEGRAAGAFYLKQQGGWAFTAKRGKEWVGGEDLLARHFMAWYLERHKYAKDSRLLVEGSPSTAVYQKFATEAGRAPEVTECLLRILNDPDAFRDNDLLRVDLESKSFTVSTRGVAEYFQRVMCRRSGFKPMTVTLMGRILTGISDKATASNTSPRMRQINISTLHRVAYEQGYYCELLEQLCE